MAEPQTAKSLHDIASLLRVPEEAPQQDQPSVQEAEEAEDQLPLDEGKDEAGEADDYTSSEVSEDAAEAVNEPPEEGEDEDDDAGDDDAEDALEDDGYLTVQDDDLIEVKIDGEVVLRSIADAKKALSGEGAIDKRLKEATEARKQAQADHTMLLEQFSLAHQNLMKTVQGMENVVFQPSVEKPDLKLRQSDPNTYLRQLDAYEADQARVKEGREAIRKMVKQQNDALAGDIQKYRAQQGKALVEAVPVLADQEQAPKLLQAMSKLAMEKYGYSPEEIQQASDHRMYRMVYDLLQFEQARGTQKGKPVQDLTDQEKKRPRKLRSGASKAKTETRKQAAQKRKVTETARQTGKVKDVAATLMTRN